jgi:hypothetical protein
MTALPALSVLGEEWPSALRRIRETLLPSRLCESRGLEHDGRVRAQAEAT